MLTWFAAGWSLSRAEAARAIEAKLVLVNGSIADKPARLIDPGDAVVLQGPPARFVSRGGDKLDAALDAFGIDVVGLRVLDAGASTGGFTDCLLQRGAGHVVAIDVGHGQLHPKIRGDRAGHACSSDFTCATSAPTRSVVTSTSSSPTCRSSRSFAPCHR